MIDILKDWLIALICGIRFVLTICVITFICGAFYRVFEAVFKYGYGLYGS